MSSYEERQQWLASLKPGDEAATHDAPVGGWLSRGTGWQTWQVVSITPKRTRFTVQRGDKTARYCDSDLSPVTPEVRRSIGQDAIDERVRIATERLWLAAERMRRDSPPVADADAWCEAAERVTQLVEQYRKDAAPKEAS